MGFCRLEPKRYLYIWITDMEDLEALSFVTVEIGHLWGKNWVNPSLPQQSRKDLPGVTFTYQSQRSSHRSYGRPWGHGLCLKELTA